MRLTYMHPIKPPGRPRGAARPARTRAHACITRRRIACFCAPSSSQTVQTVAHPAEASQGPDDDKRLASAASEQEPNAAEAVSILTTPSATQPAGPDATASQPDAAPAVDASSEFATSFQSVASGEEQQQNQVPATAATASDHDGQAVASAAQAAGAHPAAGAAAPPAAASTLASSQATSDIKDTTGTTESSAQLEASAAVDTPRPAASTAETPSTTLAAAAAPATPATPSTPAPAEGTPKDSEVPITTTIAAATTAATAATSTSTQADGGPPQAAAATAAQDASPSRAVDPASAAAAFLEPLLSTFAAVANPGKATGGAKGNNRRMAPARGNNTANEQQLVLGDRALGAVVAFTEVVTHDPFTFVRRTPLAGGVLEVTCWEGGRMLRVWLPPGYSRLEAGATGYPALYLNDGQNLFDPTLSLSGTAWDAAEAASELIATGQVPPFVIVGVDNSGVSRSWDYLPYKPGSGPGGVRKDAANWPGGGLDDYFKRLLDEVLPWAQRQYALTTRADLMAFGGSSFGGIAALYMGLKHPETFGALLVESPSLWFAMEKCLLDDLPAHKGPWPARTFVAMGSAEYSGVRPDAEPEFDARLAKYVPKVVDIIKGYEGVAPGGVKGIVDDGATHTERCWAERLPGALKFLLEPWWGVVAGEVQEELYFFAPRRLKAGGKGVMMMNKSRSRSLEAAKSVRLHLGFNYNWELAPSKVDLKAINGAPGGQWLVGVFQIPEAAYEMHFVFSDASQSVWDNNGGNNFYARIKALPPSDLGNTPEEIISAAAAAADAPADTHAQNNAGVLYFTMPDVAIAGAPIRVYLNRARSVMAQSPNCLLHYGFNQWEDGGMKEALKPTNLWRAQDVDWWSIGLTVPATAKDLSFAFSDGGTLWESNNSHNYHITVRDPHRKKGVPREVDSCISLEHAGGTMDVITLKKKPGLSRRARWTEERVLRVWTPPGFQRNAAPEGGWPVLVMNDGQNLFEDWLAHQGVSWRVGFTSAELIANGELPPFVVVAVDSAGPMRSLNYLPYPPGTGQGGFRGDAERWPGGGVDDYMRRVVEELLPLATEKYNLATDPARVAFGGGSFGGVCALYTAMHYPHIFGSVLVESPSLWVAEGAFLRDMAAFSGQLPERIFMAWGTREYSATRDHERLDVDQLLLSYYRQAHWILGTKGMRGYRMQTVEEQGAGHHESAWQWRLTGALRYLLGPWKGY